MSPFVSDELKRLSKDIINRALTRPATGRAPNLLVDRLLNAIKKQQEPKLPKV